MTSIDNDIHNLRNSLSRISSIFEIISEEGYEEELNESFLNTLEELEKSWVNYTTKLKKLHPKQQ